MPHVYANEATQLPSRRPVARGSKMSRLVLLTAAALLSVLLQRPVFAQTTDNTASSTQSTDSQSFKPVPILSGSTGFVTNFDGGDAHLGPIVPPVLLLP